MLNLNYINSLVDITVFYNYGVYLILM